MYPGRTEPRWIADSIYSLARGPGTLWHRRQGNQRKHMNATQRGIDALRLGCAFACGFLIAYLLQGAPSTSHVMEIYCKGRLAQDQTCLEIDHAGSDLEIKINTAAQIVQIAITLNVGGWSVSCLHLSCMVIDYNDWECSSESRINTTYGMYHGQYYYSLTGGSPPDFTIQESPGSHIGVFTWVDRSE
jgi:hypothetical protein